jgi:hypothetical protein
MNASIFRSSRQLAVDRQTSKGGLTETMANESEAAVSPANSKPVASSPAAERMRRHRYRKRNGLRCLAIQLRETEIDALVRRGFLKAETRNDVSAVRESFYAYLERTLGS